MYQYTVICSENCYGTQVVMAINEEKNQILWHIGEHASIKIKKEDSYPPIFRHAVKLLKIQVYETFYEREFVFGLVLV